MKFCEKCGQIVYETEIRQTPEEFEADVKKDIPEDALCHTCTFVCIFHEEKHYDCSEYNKKG